MNARILGAFIVGAGLISMSLYSATKDTVAATPANIIVAEAPERNYIAIADENDNGIPDWREQLKTVQTISLGSSTNQTATYTLPDTLTGQMAIKLFKDTVRTKQYGQFDEAQDEIVDDFELRMIQAAVDELYTFEDIVISNEGTEEDLFQYGNRVAEIALIHGVPIETENELIITKRAIDTSAPEELEKLTPIRISYENMREDMLALPVPRAVANEHLFVINAYNAMAIDLLAMEESFIDPLYTMTRMKRYQDDTKGLYDGLVNVYTALDALSISFQEEDLARQVFRFLDVW